MSRQTSIDAYNYILQNGILGRRQWQVYDILYKHGPLTAGECCELIRRYHAPHAQLNSVSPRFDEMKTRGVIIEVGKRVCRVTAREVLEWDVTPDYPVALPVAKHNAPPRPSASDFADAHPMLQWLDDWLKQNNLSLGPGLTKIKDYLPYAIARGKW